MSGLKGFAVGSLALVVLYTLLQDNVAASVGLGGGIVTEAFKRWMSPTSAAVPDRSRSLTATPPAPVKPEGTPTPLPAPAGVWT